MNEAWYGEKEIQIREEKNKEQDHIGVATMFNIQMEGELLSDQ